MTKKVGQPERAIRMIDALQQRHVILAFPFAVIRKFGDDRGGALGALIAYYSFMALFPALLVIYTLAGFIVPHYPSFEHDITHSVLRQFPVIGPQLQTRISTNVHPLHGNLIALIVGVAGATWGALGITQIAQFAMNEIWDVPNKYRPGFFPRLGRSVLLALLMLVGLVGSSVIAGLGAALHLNRFGMIATTIGSVAVVFLSTFAMFRIVTVADVKAIQLLPGVVSITIGLEVLQTIGLALLRHQLRHASNVYGTFGLIIGLVGWLYLFAQMIVYSAEANVVYLQRLWPRSIVQPPLTRADKRALIDIARREERRKDQNITVDFDDASNT